MSQPIKKKGATILLVAGIPAAGKSYFGAWLEATHQFLNVDVERPSGREPHELVELLRRYHGAGDARSFVAEIRRGDRPIVLNWGFPTGCLSFVQQLKAQGLVLWWFDADPSAARAAFLQRGDVPIECFDKQMADIEANHEAIQTTFRPNTLTTLKAGGARLTPKVIYNSMSALGRKHRG